MNIFTLVVIFIVGLAVLWLGAKWLVRGSSDLAIMLGVRPIIVGLTVVAFGTSAPELVVSVMAAVSNSPDVAIGNVVGSNIANICLIVGLTATILPIYSDRSFLKMDIPPLFGAMALLYAVSWDGTISRLDAGALLLGLLIFNLMTYRGADKRGAAIEEEASRSDKSGVAILLAIIGLVALTGGARMMVFSAVEIARRAGISEVVIGATIVAIGTSLPELATSLTAVIKKQPDIGLGNVIGSNVFNICSIMGIAPLFRPLPVSRHLLHYEYTFMFISALVLTAMLVKKRNRITRIEGIILFAGYLAFLAWSFYKG